MYTYIYYTGIFLKRFLINICYNEIYVSYTYLYILDYYRDIKDIKIYKGSI